MELQQRGPEQEGLQDTGRGVVGRDEVPFQYERWVEGIWTDLLAWMMNAQTMVRNIRGWAVEHAQPVADLVNRADVEIALGNVSLRSAIRQPVASALLSDWPKTVPHWTAQSVDVAELLAATARYQTSLTRTDLKRFTFVGGHSRTELLEALKRYEEAHAILDHAVRQLRQLQATPPVWPCSHCREPIPTNRGRAAYYCSPECRQKAAYQRRKETAVR